MAATDPDAAPRATRLGESAIKTYRYLRLAMVALVVMLAAAVLVEWSRTDPGCWQPSISGYFYTPAKAVFVGTLTAMGVCMIALKGNTEREDVLLNVAGMLAPVVAFVPPLDESACRSVAVPLRDTGADIANNVAALFVAGVLAPAIAVGVALRGGASRQDGWDRRHLLGLAVAALILAGGIAWFVLDRPGFDSGAHYAAAIPMFGCFVAVVALNGGPGGARPRVNRYLLIAAFMVASTVVPLVAMVVLDWDHAVLWIEGLLIGSFAAFWLIQTHELWHRGVRH
jgi:hypothetical protein